MAMTFLLTKYSALTDAHIPSWHERSLEHSS